MAFLVIHLSTGEKDCKNPLMYQKSYDFLELIPVLTMTITLRISKSELKNLIPNFKTGKQ